MNELIPLALQNTADAYALYDEVPFDLAEDEIQQYATDKGMRRFGTIGSARVVTAAPSASWRTAIGG